MRKSKLKSSNHTFDNSVLYSVFSTILLDIEGSLQWDSCDCGDGYGCSHGSYVYEIHIKNDDKTHMLDVESDYISFQNNGRYACLPIPDVTVFDFIRICQLCEIELEFSDYAVSLLK